MLYAMIILDLAYNSSVMHNCVRNGSVVADWRGTRTEVLCRSVHSPRSVFLNFYNVHLVNALIWNEI